MFIFIKRSYFYAVFSCSFIFLSLPLCNRMLYGCVVANGFKVFIGLEKRLRASLAYGRLTGRRLSHLPSVVLDLISSSGKFPNCIYYPITFSNHVIAASCPKWSRYPVGYTEMNKVLVILLKIIFDNQ